LTRYTLEEAKRLRFAGSIFSDIPVSNSYVTRGSIHKTPKSGITPIYLWRLWLEQWQAGLVFVLFGLHALAPVTIKEIQSRRKALAQLR
jgi:hypothetical protein